MAEDKGNFSMQETTLEDVQALRELMELLILVNIRCDNPEVAKRYFGRDTPGMCFVDFVNLTEYSRGQLVYLPVYEFATSFADANKEHPFTIVLIPCEMVIVTALPTQAQLKWFCTGGIGFVPLLSDELEERETLVDGGTVSEKKRVLTPLHAEDFDGA